ncbi:hypothetical protein PENSPDRAFT_374453 [Peniophora sp. CONT]|nr:hypothetical protein PENSPDRAFT_374453 [Peniophora sp. CONT]
MILHSHHTDKSGRHQTGPSGTCFEEHRAVIASCADVDAAGNALPRLKARREERG